MGQPGEPARALRTGSRNLLARTLARPRPALPRLLARTMPFFCSTNVDPFTRLDTTATPRPSDTAAGLGPRAPSPAAAAAAAVPMPPAPPSAARARTAPHGLGEERRGEGRRGSGSSDSDCEVSGIRGWMGSMQKGQRRSRKASAVCVDAEK